MSDIPTDLLYTEEHEYLKRTEDDAVYQVGITDYAQGELGDVVYVELPQVGTSLARMEVFGTVEAVKAVSELFSPVTGAVVDVNDALANDPGLVNTDTYGRGWMLKIRLANPEELDALLGPEEYGKIIGEG